MQADSASLPHAKGLSLASAEDDDRVEMANLAGLGHGERLSRPTRIHACDAPRKWQPMSSGDVGRGRFVLRSDPLISSGPAPLLGKWTSRPQKDRLGTTFAEKSVSS